MPVDRKFWSGALIVVTVVVAGAGTLPALLLRPATSEVPDPPVAPAAVSVAAPAEQPKHVQRPAVAEASASAATPESAAVGVAQPAAVAAAVTPVALPPVQPIDAPRVSAASQGVLATDAVKKTEQVTKVATAREAKRKQRATRPAPYSIRDFFAANR